LSRRCIYRSLTTASAYSNKLRTAQLALPVDSCNAVYGSVTGYETSAVNLARISSANDNVFSDGVSTQLATVTGSPQAGYQASLQVAMLA
jgi:hypothetical protein